MQIRLRNDKRLFLSLKNNRGHGPRTGYQMYYKLMGERLKHAKKYPVMKLHHNICAAHLKHWAPKTCSSPAYKANWVEPIKAPNVTTARSPW